MPCGKHGLSAYEPNEKIVSFAGKRMFKIVISLYQISNKKQFITSFPVREYPIFTIVAELKI